MKRKAPQYAENAKRDHVNLKEKEYAIYAAKNKVDNTDIGELHNVSDATPTQGQVLVFNSITNEWEPGNASGGGSGIPGLDKIVDRFPLQFLADSGASGTPSFGVPPGMDQLIDRNLVDLLAGGRGSAQGAAPSNTMNPLAVSFIGF
jgi:hypothetical protein